MKWNKTESSVSVIDATPPPTTRRKFPKLVIKLYNDKLKKMEFVTIECPKTKRLLDKTPMEKIQEVKPDNYDQLINNPYDPDSVLVPETSVSLDCIPESPETAETPKNVRRSLGTPRFQGASYERYRLYNTMLSPIPYLNDPQTPRLCETLKSPVPQPSPQETPMPQLSPPAKIPIPKTKRRFKEKKRTPVRPIKSVRFSPPRIADRLRSNKKRLEKERASVSPKATVLSPRFNPLKNFATCPARPVVPLVSKSEVCPKIHKKPAKGVHPPCAVMVNKAMMELGGTKGASYQAIKKFIGNNFEFDVERYAHFIINALKKGTEKGEYVQVKGQGATGSFKLKFPAANSNNDKCKKTPQKKEVAPTIKKKVTTTPKKPEKVTIKMKATVPKQKVNKASPKPKKMKSDSKKEKTASKKKATTVQRSPVRPSAWPPICRVCTIHCPCGKPRNNYSKLRRVTQ